MTASVHLCKYPEAEGALIEPVLEQAVTRMQHIVLLGRQKRNQEKIKTKYPLAEMTVIHQDQVLLDEIARLEPYIQAELNVHKVSYSTQESAFINLFAKPNSPILGKRLGKRFKHFKGAIESLSSDTINEFQETGQIFIDGELLSCL